MKQRYYPGRRVQITADKSLAKNISYPDLMGRIGATGTIISIEHPTIPSLSSEEFLCYYIKMDQDNAEVCAPQDSISLIHDNNL